MPTAFVRTRIFLAVAALPLALALQSRAFGQEPALEVFYTKLEPREEFKYTWQGKEATCSAGVFRWEVPQTEFGTNGLDRNFTGYCAEIRVPIVAQKLYRFRINSLYETRNYEGVVDKEQAPLLAQKRAIYVKELFGRYYRDPVQKSANANEVIALQVALWEVIQETEPAEGAAKFDLFAGDFQANYPRADAPAFVRTAQGYLNSLAGDDAAFYQNPDLRGRELIRLQGIENADKEVAQSQFALRFGGGVGLGNRNLTSALTTGSGLAPGNASGNSDPNNRNGNAPGGSGFVGIGGNGGGVPGGGVTAPPPPGTTPPPDSPPPGIPPITTPPNAGPPQQPPGNPNEQPPVSGIPVPAPAGLLLGAIAIGTLATWRIRARLLASRVRQMSDGTR